MKYYELTINTKEADALLERVVSYLPAPPVLQQKNPSFLSLEFYTEPEKIQELEKKLKTDFLRYMILAKEPPREAKPKRRSMKKPFLQTESSETLASDDKGTAAPSSDRKKKVDLKEIDKKLEEMFKEE